MLDSVQMILLTAAPSQSFLSLSILIPVVIIAGIIFGTVLLVQKKIKPKAKQEKTLESQPLTDSQKGAFTKYFVDSDETLVSSLGNSYIENFIADGTLGNGFSVISDKRVYFRGSCLTGNGKRFIKSDEERVVDLKDITGSGFIYQREVGILISIALIIMVLLAAMGFMAVGWGAFGGYTFSDVKQAEQMLKKDQSALETAKKELPVLEGIEELNKIITDYELNSGSDNPWDSVYDKTKKSSNEAEGTIGFFADALLNGVMANECSELSLMFFESACTEYDYNDPLPLDCISEYDTFIAEVPKIAESLGKDNPMNMQEWIRPLGEIFYSIYRQPERFYIMYNVGDFDGITGNENNGELADYLVTQLTQAKADMVSLFALSKPADYEQTYQNAKQQIAQFEESNKEQTEKIATLERQVANTASAISMMKSSASETTKVNIFYFIGEAILASAMVSVVLLFANYLRRRRTFFEINYAGGKIAFNVSLYPKAEIDDFQKQLRRAKDFVASHTAAAMPQPVAVSAAPAAPVAPAARTKADELEKYASLLEKGVITKEEFETLKRKALDE